MRCIPATFTCLLLFASPVAASLQVDPLTPNSLTGFNEFASILGAIKPDPLGPGLTKVITGDITVTVTGILRFYFHASESGFNNEFWVDDLDVSTPTFKEQENGTYIAWTNPATPFATFLVTAGTTFSQLNAIFKTDGQSGGGLDAAINTPGFGIFVTADNNYDPSHLYFGFDDNGAGIDDNHDDMIVSVTFEAVEPPPGSGLDLPEPFSGLVWCGLAAAAVLAPGFARRRS